jgi:hypothetical protein
MLLLCLISCMSNQQNNTEIMQSTGNYIIPDSLISFFQNYSNEKLRPLVSTTNAGETDLPYFAEEFVITYIVKGFTCKDTAWCAQAAKTLIEKGAIKIQSSESGYFVIGSERNLLSSFDAPNLKEQYSNRHLNTPLVLNFHEIFKEKRNLYDKTTISGLPRDYEILIIKSGNKYVLPDKYKYDWNLLPEQLKHGYTNGIAYSKDKTSILNWVVAW